MGRKVYEKIKIYNKALLKASSRGSNFSHLKEKWKNIIIEEGEISGNKAIEKKRNILD